MAPGILYIVSWRLPVTKTIVGTLIIHFKASSVAAGIIAQIDTSLREVGSGGRQGSGVSALESWGSRVIEPPPDHLKSLGNTANGARLSLPEVIPRDVQPVRVV